MKKHILTSLLTMMTLSMGAQSFCSKWANFVLAAVASLFLLAQEIQL